MCECLLIYASSLSMCCCRDWPAWSTDSPAAHEGDDGEEGSLSAAHGEPQWSTNPHCISWRTRCTSGLIHPKGREPKHNQTPNRNCILCRGAHTGAGFLAQAVPLENPHWNGLFLVDGTPQEGFMLEQLMKSCLTWQGSHAVEKEQPKEEGGGEMGCFAQTAIPPFPNPLQWWEQDDVEEWMNDIELQEKLGIWRRYF